MAGNSSYWDDTMSVIDISAASADSQVHHTKLINRDPDHRDQDPIRRLIKATPTSTRRNNMNAVRSISWKDQMAGYIQPETHQVVRRDSVIERNNTQTQMEVKTSRRHEQMEENDMEDKIEEPPNGKMRRVDDLLHSRRVVFEETTIPIQEISSNRMIQESLGKKVWISVVVMLVITLVLVFRVALTGFWMDDGPFTTINLVSGSIQILFYGWFVVRRIVVNIITRGAKPKYYNWTLFRRTAYCGILCVYMSTLALDMILIGRYLSIDSDELVKGELHAQLWLILMCTFAMIVFVSIVLLEFINHRYNIIGIRKTIKHMITKVTDDAIGQEKIYIPVPRH